MRAHRETMESFQANRMARMVNLLLQTLLMLLLFVLALVVGDLMGAGQNFVE